MQLSTKLVLIVLCFYFQSVFCCPSSHTEKDSKETEVIQKRSKLASSEKRGKSLGKDPAKRCMVFFVFFFQNWIDSTISRVSFLSQIIALIN